MRVLIAGGCGFVGRHLVDFLLEYTDWHLVIVDSSYEWARNGQRERITNVVANLRYRINPGTGDLIGDVDAIINLAAASDVSAFISRPGPLILNNVEITLSLLEWAQGLPSLTHFIQVSTNEVYGPVGAGSPQTEWSPVIPPTPYSASKAAQEALAVSWWRTYGVPVVVVNTMHLFGEGQPSERFIPAAVQRLLAGDAVPVYGQQVAGHWVSSSRCWLYAKDLASALHWLLSQPVTRWPEADRPDRWNVAGPEVKLDQLVDLIAGHLNVDPLVAWVDVQEARPGHEHRYALDTTKITQAGWKPHYGFHAGLNRTIAWMVDHEA